MGGYAWDHDRTELLRKLWEEGLSGERIAHRLGGVTRNAVIGKLHRLRLARDADELKQFRRTRGRKSGAESTGWRGKQALRLSGTPTTPKPDLPPAAPYVPEAPPVAPDGERKGVPLEMRTGCAWPFGDSRDGGLTYCNEPCCQVIVRGHGSQARHSVPYCSWHWAVRRTSRNTDIV